MAGFKNIFYDEGIRFSLVINHHWKRKKMQGIIVELLFGKSNDMIIICGQRVGQDQPARALSVYDRPKRLLNQYSLGREQLNI
jgi:hypothetical protein